MTAKKATADISSPSDDETTPAEANKEKEAAVKDTPYTEESQPVENITSDSNKKQGRLAQVVLWLVIAGGVVWGFINREQLVPYVQDRLIPQAQDLVKNLQSSREEYSDDATSTTDSSMMVESVEIDATEAEAPIDSTMDTRTENTAALAADETEKPVGTVINIEKALANPEDSTLTSLQHKVTMQERRIAALETIVADLSNSMIEDMGTGTRTPRLIIDENGMLAPAAPPAAANNKAMEQRMDAFESRMQTELDQSAQKVQSLYAIWQIEQAIQSGAPYREALTLLASHLPNPAEQQASIQPLYEYADSGLPTTQVLAAELRPLAAEIIHQSASPNDDAPFMDKLGHSLQGLVSIRKKELELPKVAADLDGSVALDQYFSYIELALDSGNTTRALQYYTRMKNIYTDIDFSALVPWETKLENQHMAVEVVGAIKQNLFDTDQQSAGNPS